ncbi:hypothetical protein [Streptomyces flaveolus]|uniref:hypothetical protein n=1 Tax=Streptomyces flaveolus TaxID=67297 RepID=UPI003F4CECD0
MSVPSAFTASLPPAERAAYGRKARQRASRSCHGWYETGQRRVDPVELASSMTVPSL